MTETNLPHCKYITTFIIWCISAVFLFQSVAIIIDFDNTQTYINNTCHGIGNLSIRHWNKVNKRATTITKSLDSDQNITLYYPPVNVWLFWENGEARAWYDQLKTFNNSNMTYPCYINYPQNIGISHHLNNIWIYYTISATTFIICCWCIIYCCIERTHTRNREYYPLN